MAVSNAAPIALVKAHQRENETVSAPKSTPRKVQQEKSRIPPDSFFYNKVVPILLIVMAVVTAIIILIAAGVLLGFVPFR